MLLIAICLGLLLCWALFIISDLLSKPLDKTGSRLSKFGASTFGLALLLIHLFDLPGFVIGFMLAQCFLLTITGLAICFRDRNIAQNEEIRLERLAKAAAKKEKSATKKAPSSSHKSSKSDEHPHRHRHSSGASTPHSVPTPGMMMEPEPEMPQPIEDNVN